jgi:type III pantothenate kinase
VTPDIVVDIGNSRIKWGWCQDGRVERVSNLGDDVEEWNREIANFAGKPTWAVVSVHPGRMERFREWANTRRDTVLVINHHQQIPVPIWISSPHTVGLDRLCATLAAAKLYGPEEPLLVIQVGTAVVLNLVSPTGAFRGGAILPGFQLMATALSTGTSQLPKVEITQPESIFPGENTADAIRRGIYYAIKGAIVMLRSGFTMTVDHYELKVILTGGDAHLLENDLSQPVIHVPTLTLEGIRIAAEALP